jgi:hypothetical protein
MPTSLAKLQEAKPEVYKFVASVMDPVAMTAAGRAKFQLLADHERFLDVAGRAVARRGGPPRRSTWVRRGRGVIKALLPKLAALPDGTAPAIGATLKETVQVSPGETAPGDDALPPGADRDRPRPRPSTPSRQPAAVTWPWSASSGRPPLDASQTGD